MYFALEMKFHYFLLSSIQQMIRKNKHCGELVASHMDSSHLDVEMSIVENILKIPANECVADTIKSLTRFNQYRSKFEFWYPQNEQNNDILNRALQRSTANLSQFFPHIENFA